MKLLIHSQTTVALLKFGNKQVISPHNLWWEKLLFHAGFKVNHYKEKGFCWLMGGGVWKGDTILNIWQICCIIKLKWSPLLKFIPVGFISNVYVYFLQTCKSYAAFPDIQHYSESYGLGSFEDINAVWVIGCFSGNMIFLLLMFPCLHCYTVCKFRHVLSSHLFRQKLSGDTQLNVSELFSCVTL